ncbi:MAG TPA: multicopper oxidase domain-containing protein, partial [Lysobacter sp.]|nr:multicopper oxidase domain-containing protein [Lysobacter sp.]
MPIDSSGLPPAAPSRRRFVTGLAVGGLAAGMGLWRFPALAASGVAQPLQTLSGTDFDLSIGGSMVDFTGRARPAVTVNGALPAPLLRWREGDTVTVRVANRLRDAYSSIHWHGILLPANMDGVPGLSFDGIAPGETFTYKFQLQQSGTRFRLPDDTPLPASTRQKATGSVLPAEPDFPDFTE